MTSLYMQAELNLQRIQREVGLHVRIVVVTKKHSSELIKSLYASGQRDFAESYVNEWWKKREELKADCPEIVWHFIGRIQSNKIKKIAQAQMVHSIVSARHAKLLSDERFANSQDALPVLLQVNLDPSDGRGGFAKQDLLKIIKAVLGFSGINLRGLMTILPLHGVDSSESLFESVRVLRDELQEQLGTDLPELSMGMSNDYLQAITCGATMLRLGAVICGAR